MGVFEHDPSLPVNNSGCINVTWVSYQSVCGWFAIREIWARRQNRPVFKLHVVEPQTHVTELGEVPFDQGHAEIAEEEHWL